MFIRIKRKYNKNSNKAKITWCGVIYLGACAVKCKVDNLEEIKKVFISIGIKVVEGTH